MFELRTLGGASLLRDGIPVTGAATQRRPLAVLAQLAVAGEMGVSREKLVGRLWPDSTEDAARRVLAQTLYALRRSLAEDHLVDGTSTLRLNPAVIGSDVSRFTGAVEHGDVERAAAEYGGVFLDGFHLSDAAEFERWVDDERLRLQREYANVLEALAERAAAHSDHASEAEWWRRRAVLDPLDTRIGACLMRALHASGDIGGALQHARVHDALAREELGESTPSPLLELANELRSRPAREDRATVLPRSALDAESAPMAEARSSTALAPAPDRRTRRWRLVVGLVAAAVLAGMAWLFARRAGERAPTTDAGLTTLAVLPFVTLTPRADLQFLRVGIADAIITQLANARQLRVRPTTAILSFDDERVDPRRAGQLLAAEYVVTGAVQDVGGRLRVSVQLVEAADRTPRWGASYELPRADLLGLQDSVAHRVVDALRVRLSEAERERLFRRYTANTAAYEAYLRGRSELARHTDAGTRAAIDAFSHAVTLDSTYALAWAGLGMASAEMHLRFASGPAVKVWRDSAQAQTLHALALDSSLAEVHQSLAAVARKSDFDWDRTILYSRRALELSSSLDLPHYYIAAAFYHLGLLEEAEREVQKGAAVNPAGDHLEQLRSHAVTALFSGRYREALEALEEADRLGDRSISGTYLAQARYYAGSRSDAEPVLRQLVRTGSASGAARARATLASIVAAAGSRSEAVALVRAAEGGDYMDHHVAYSIGAAHAQLGDRRAAVQWLERAASSGFPCYAWYGRDPLLAPLRGDSAFTRLLTELRQTSERARDRYAGPAKIRPP